MKSDIDELLEMVDGWKFKLHAKLKDIKPEERPATGFTEPPGMLRPPQRLISVVTLRTQPGRSSVSWRV